MSVQNRVIASLHPPETGIVRTRQEQIEVLLHRFHSYVVEAAEKMKKAEENGIRIQNPDVLQEVIMPNIASFAVGENLEDPVSYLLDCAQMLYFMSTNTLIFTAQALSARSAHDQVTANHVAEFAQICNTNMALFTRELMMAAHAQISSGLVNADGQPLH